MKLISNSLIERVRKLEIEQQRQDTALSRMSSLTEDVKKLEAALAHIDESGFKPNQEDIDFYRDLKEAERLEAEITQMEDYEVKDFNEKRYFDEISKLKAELSGTLPTAGTPKNNSVSTQASASSASTAMPKNGKTSAAITQGLKPNLNSEPQKTGLQNGYIICLMFNPQAPTEWSEESGGGWRESGRGMCYSTPEKAKAVYQELKKKFPNYPLKINKR